MRERRGTLNDLEKEQIIEEIITKVETKNHSSQIIK